MAIRTDQAIVLRLSDYSETSQIVTLFTAESGLVRLIAKGTRRSTRTRVATGLDLLEYGEASYVPPRGDAGLGTLTEWVQRDAFRGLRDRLECLYAGLYTAELVNALTEEYDSHPPLFDALLCVLRALAAGEKPLAALVRFQLDLATAIGYAPSFDQCVGCGRPPPRGRSAFFSSTAGGLLCRDCEMHYVEKRRLPATLAGREPDADNSQAWFDLLDYHLRHVAGKPFPTAQRLRAR